MTATLPSGEVYEQLSGELLDPLLLHEGCEKVRENLRTLECMSESRGTKQLGREFESGGLDKSVFVRCGLAAMQTAGETRTDCFAATLALCCVRLVFELRSHAVQRSEKQIVLSPRRVGSVLPRIAG